MVEEREFVGFEPLFALGVFVSCTTAVLGATIPYYTAGLLIGFIGVTALCLHFEVLNMSGNSIKAVLLLMAFCSGVFCGITGKLTDIARVGHLTEAMKGTGVLIQEAIDNIPFQNHDTNSLLKALLTGNRDDIPPHITHAFRRSGASHILALSGLHLGIIYSIICFIFNILGNSLKARISRSVLVIAICSAYTLATGASSSLVRALTFIILRETGKITGRKSDLKTILKKGLLIHLTINPTDITDIGFQLSYAAMAGIAWIHPWLKQIWTANDAGGPLKRVWDNASLSISCQLTTGPLAFHYFGSIPKYFLLTNLLALPLTGIIIPATIITTILFISGLCPRFVIEALEALVATLIHILETIASM